MNSSAMIGCDRSLETCKAAAIIAEAEKTCLCVRKWNGNVHPSEPTKTVSASDVLYGDRVFPR
jgi:hypothetical protein